MNGPAITALARRADAGTVRLGPRDVAGLVLAGDMYGAPYDLLAAFLSVRPDRARGIVARWRSAGYAATGRLGAGPGMVLADPGHIPMIITACLLRVYFEPGLLLCFLRWPVGGPVKA